MNAAPPDDALTDLLARWRQGDRVATERLFAAIYAELRRRARRYVARQPAAALTPTELVNETFLKLSEAAAPGTWKDRHHFFAVASLAMRHVLVDLARRRLARKRSAPPPEDAAALDRRATELLALNQALEELKAVDERLYQVVELRFFGGLSFDEAAGVLELSPRTVQRDWRKARALLGERLGSGPPA